VHDPAQGVRKLPLAELSRHFTGVALELSPTSDFKPVSAKQKVTARALIGRIEGWRGAMVHILVIAISLELLSIASPFFLQIVLDQIITSSDHGLLNALTAGFCGLTIVSSLLGAARSWAIARVSSLVNVQWAANLFLHLMRLPLSWFGKRHVGDVVSRFTSIQSIQRTLTNQFVSAVLDGAMSGATLIVMFLYAGSLAWTVVLLFFVYTLLRLVIFGSLKRANEEQITFGARQQSELLESIRGVQSIKLANKEAERLARYANATVSAANGDIKVQRINIACTLANQWTLGLGRILVIWLGASIVLSGSLSVGMLVAFVAYADQFVTRVTALVDKGMEFRMLKLHTERVADIALTEPEELNGRGFSRLPLKADIELKNVCFRYSEEDPWILQDCNLYLEEGCSLAVTGPSGCGKSTLAKIILGLLKPTSGTVMFGGLPIETIGLSNYRQSIGAVMQDDQLFAGSLYDNISFFDAESTMERVVAAAKLAAVHEDILRIPMAYQTPVGDMGSSLSGGQKQRVILARALYREPQLLVLDEATSHLDVAREREVNESIRKLKVTRVIIAHRPETIRSADRVVALCDGRTKLVEAGNLLSIDASPGLSGDLLEKEQLV
jgi:ATP-binding cassette subfamily B protein RaxB